MGIAVMKVFEYSVECDNCEATEVFHTWDEGNGIRVHDKRTALKASGYKVRDGQILCPECLKQDDSIRRNAPWK